jgi:hypothetical protein
MARATMTLLPGALWALALACGGGESSPTADAALLDAPSVGDAAWPDADLLDSNLPDAYVDLDATLDPATCPETYGPASLAETFEIGVEADGFDLDGAADPDGDGQPDNILGSHAGLRLLLNTECANSIADGSMRVLTEIRDLAAFDADDDDVTLVLYAGVDSDGSHANDFSGEAQFYYGRDWVEWDDCSPKSPMQSEYTGGILSGSADAVLFYVDMLGGFIRLERVQFETQVEEDLAGARTPIGEQARFGGAVVQCSLAKGDGIIGLSAQHDVTRVFQIQPDIDLDGDGLETVLADSAGIISCTDGDGTTVVEGPMCGCDPRMADGYSAVFLLDIRGAIILGPAPE